MNGHRQRWMAAAVGLVVIAGVTGCGNDHRDGNSRSGVENHSGVENQGGSPAVRFTDGRLLYVAGDRGDQIPDFSAVGYRQGAQPPDVPVKVAVVSGVEGDDTGRIQAAIDEVAGMAADAAGLRGAVQLGPGGFRVHASLKLASGVVLRGSGSGADGTTLVAVGAPGPLIVVGGEDGYQPTGRTAKVTDSYVPVGARTFTVDDAAGFTVGDRVVVQRPTTQAWIDAIGMADIPGKKDKKGKGRKNSEQAGESDGEGWEPGPGILATRTITAVTGTTVTVDAPITTSIDSAYGGGTVWHYTLPGEVTDAGVENLAADATAFTTDPGYAKLVNGKNAGAGAFKSMLVSYGACRDVWTRGVQLTHFGAGFRVHDNASRVTIEDAADLEMAIPAELAPPPAFMVGGQQVLVRNTTVTGDHVHAWTTQAFAAGPNVFTQGTARSLRGDGQVDAGPHLRWGSGTLYDNLTIDSSDGKFAIDNAWSGGTGHGWQGANTMFWNTTSARYTILQPPTAYNWAYGIKGEQAPGKHDDELPTKSDLGAIVSPGKPVQPASLYAEQLRERR